MIILMAVIIMFIIITFISIIWMVLMLVMVMMMNETNRWMESLPSKNNQNQPIGLDRLQFTAMGIVMRAR